MEDLKRYKEKKDISGNYNPDSEENPREPIESPNPQPTQKEEVGVPGQQSNAPSEGEKILTFEDFLKSQKGNNEDDDEAWKKEEKKHKARAIIGAIADAMIGFANIHYATKGAPAINVGEGMSAKEKARWDKAVEARKAQREAYLKQAREDWWKTQEMSYKKAKDEREYELKERDQAVKEAKEERNKRSAELRDLLMLGKIDVAQIDAQYAKDIHEANIDLKKSQAYKNYHPTSGGGSKQGKYTAYDKDWNAHYFDTAKEAEWFAKQQGTWNYQKTETQKDYQRSSSQSSGGFPMAPNKSGNEKDEKEQITIPGF